MKIKELLDDKGVPFWNQGKNVSKGWIGLRCPFCDDDSNHLGIRLSDNKCKCWKCGEKGLTQTLKGILEISKGEAFSLAKTLESNLDEEEDFSSLTVENKFDGLIPKTKLPVESSPHFPKLHFDYLKKRGFGLRTIRKYKLRAVYTVGKYKFRIIIPIIFENKIVSFTSRDVTGEAELRYLAAPQIGIGPRDFVYNLDSIREGQNAVLVEGPIDVWRLGENAISFFGITRSEKQLLHLYKKKIKKLYIFFDNDEPGKRASWKQAKEISPFVEEVNIIRLEYKKDPGELNQEEAEILMEKIRKS